MKTAVAARNDEGSQKLWLRLPLPEDRAMICAHEFEGKTGETDKDLWNVVKIGNNEVFTFPKQGLARGEKPAAIILRAHAKKVQAGSAK